MNFAPPGGIKRTGKSIPENSRTSTKSCAGLIRLTPDEFSKIVLLPQGEFQKFLEEKTKERAAVLEKLFPTNIHSSVSQRLKDEAKEKREVIKKIEDRLEKLGEIFDHDKYEEQAAELQKKQKALQKELKAKQEALVEIAGNLKIAEELIGDFNRRDLCQKTAGELEAEAPAIEELKEKLKRAEKTNIVVPAGKIRKQYEEDLGKARIEHSRLLAEQKTNLEALKAHGQELEKLQDLDQQLTAVRTARAELEKNKKKFQELESLKADLINRGADLKIREEALGEQAMGLQKLTKALAAVGDLSTEQEKSNLALHAVIEDLNKAELAARDAGEKSSLEKALALTNNRVKELTLQEEKALKNHEINKLHLRELEEKKEAAVCSTLADGLTDNEPCPVCGSKEHPAPAQDVPAFTEEDILENAREHEIESAEKLKTAGQNLIGVRKELESIQEQLNKYQTTPSLEAAIQLVTNLQKKKGGLETTLKKLAEELGNQEKLRKQIEQLREAETKEKEIYNGLNVNFLADQKRLLALEKDLGGAQDFAKELKRLDGSIAELDGSINSIRETQVRLEKEQGKIQTGIETVSTQIKTLDGHFKKADADFQTLLKDNDFASMEEARNSYIAPDKQEAHKTSIQSFEEQRRDTAQELENLSKRLKGKTKPAVEELRRKDGEVRSAVAEMETRKDVLNGDLLRLNDNKKEFEELNREREKQGKNSSQLIRLAEDLNGNNDKKVSFKNFVLGIYLELVTEMAGKRLERMSEGRYSLQVNDQGYDQRIQAGLELDVFDAHTGKTRNVRTLSGGEKFMASISLALGLADVIQERSGGIQIDAIFIDEGFGSLDDQALDRAIGILDEIRGSRVVGIISHVNELKTRIQSRVEVIKGRDGSRIRIAAG